ncbi:hypothetical protein [Clostridium hydrogeniformans]|uniref:hypothetical protein n=1 Tax=Clostridium hydrogeniformans TaxID=349933 RepID=UPI000B2BACFB|nr:hypothetical protein [Clostridium hydrogeniformans]
MAKKGMRRPGVSDPHGTETNKKQKFPKNQVTPVPEIQGKAKAGHKKANDDHVDYFDYK